MTNCNFAFARMTKSNPAFVRMTLLYYTFFPMANAFFRSAEFFLTSPALSAPVAQRAPLSFTPSKQAIHPPMPRFAMFMAFASVSAAEVNR